MTKPEMSVAEALEVAQKVLNGDEDAHTSGNISTCRCTEAAAVLRRLAPFVEAAMNLGAVYVAHQEGTVDAGVDNAGIAILEDFMAVYRAMKEQADGK